MGQPAASRAISIVAIDIHLIQPPGADARRCRCRTRSAASSTAALSTDVKIEGSRRRRSTAPPPTRRRTFRIGGIVRQPAEQQGRRSSRGSATVTINGKPAARAGDTAATCNDPVDLPVGHRRRRGTVLIGG